MMAERFHPDLTSFSSPYHEANFQPVLELLRGDAVVPSSMPAELSAKERYLAEVRALLTELARLDPAGPAKMTDGRVNFEDAEWPFMAAVYTTLAMCEMAEAWDDQRAWLHAECAFALQLIRTPALSGFIAPHFGEPFPPDGRVEECSGFVSGLYLNAATRFREVFQDRSEDIWIHGIAKAVERGVAERGMLDSYKDMSLVSDTANAVAGLARFGRLFKDDAARTQAAGWIESLKDHYLDPETGLFCSYVNPDTQTVEQGPSGINFMYGIVPLFEIDAGFAREQWAAAQQTLVFRLDNWLGLAAPLLVSRGLPVEFRDVSVCLETPYRGKVVAADLIKSNADSGPVVFGVGSTATAFLLAAANAAGEPDMAASLETAAVLFGDPLYRETALYYTNLIHPVGQAGLLYGKSLGLRSGK